MRQLVTAFYEGVRALPFADVKLLRNLYAAAAEPAADKR